MPEITVSQVFSWNKLFNEDPVTHRKAVYLYSSDSTYIELALDEDSGKALDMVVGLLEKLMTGKLILTGTIRQKAAIQTINVPASTTQTYAPAIVTPEDQQAIAAEAELKPQMTDPLIV
jgi:hypothetical protein